MPGSQDSGLGRAQHVRAWISGFGSFGISLGLKSGGEGLRFGVGVQGSDLEGVRVQECRIRRLGFRV